MKKVLIQTLLYVLLILLYLIKWIQGRMAKTLEHQTRFRNARILAELLRHQNEELRQDLEL